MKGAEKTSGGFFSGFLSNAAKLGSATLAFGALKDVVGGAVDLFGDLAGAAADEKMGMDRLIKTVHNAGVNYKGMVGDIDTAIAAGERKAYQDDQVRDSLGLLVGKYKDVTKAQNVQALAMDLARAKGLDLNAATKLLLGSGSKQATMLAKLGISIDKGADETTRFGQIQEAVAGQADLFANSAAGAAERTAEAFQNAKEDIGAAILPLQTQILGGFADFLQSDTFQGAIVFIKDLIGIALPQAITFLQTTFGPLIQTVKDVGQIFVDMITTGESVGREWDNMTGILSILANYVAGIGGAFHTFFDSISQGQDILLAIGDLLGSLADNVLTAIQDLIIFVSSELPNWIAQLQKWGQALIDWIAPMIPPALAQLVAWGQALWSWLLNTGLPTAVQTLQTLGQAFIDWIGPLIPPALAQLVAWGQAIWGWLIGTALPTAVTTLLALGQAFVDWIGPVIPPLLAKLVELGQGVWAWITNTAIPTARDNLALLAARFWLWFTENDVAGKVLDTLGTWIGGIIGWFGEQIPKLIGAALDWALSVMDNLFPKPGQAESKGDDWFGKVIAWAAAQIPKLVQMSNEWAAEFLNWIERDVLPVLIPRLEQIAVKMAQWTTQVAGPAIITALQSWSAAFLNWVNDVISQQVSHLNMIATGIANWVNGQISAMLNQGSRIGGSIVSGIQSGIAGAWNGFLGWVHDKVMELPEAVRNLLGIHSPSAVFADSVGVPIVEGIAQGVGNSWPMLEEVMSAGLIDTITNAATAAQIGAARAGALIINSAGAAVLNGWGDLITELNSPSRNIGKIMMDLLTISKDSAALGITDVATMALGWFDKIASGGKIDFGALDKDFTDAMYGMLNSADPSLRALALMWKTNWDQIAATQKAVTDEINWQSADSIAKANLILEGYTVAWEALNNASSNSVVKANILLDGYTDAYVKHYNDLLKIASDFGSKYADVLDNPAGMGAYQDAAGTSAKAKTTTSASASLREQVDFLKSLVGAKMPSKEEIGAFWASARYVLDLFAQGSDDLKDKASDVAAHIAGNVGAIMGGISAALDPILKMGDVQKVSRDTIEGAFSNIWWALHQLNIVMASGELQGDFQARAKAFADTLTTIFQALGDAMAIGTAGKGVDFSGLLDGVKQVFETLAPLIKTNLDPTATAGIGYEWAFGWEAITNWFRTAWSIKFGNILHITMTDLRLILQGEAGGFGEAGHMLGDAVISGMVAAILAGAGQVAAAVAAVMPGTTGGGTQTPYVPPTGGGGSGSGSGGGGGLRGPTAQSVNNTSGFTSNNSASTAGGTTIHIGSLVFNSGSGQDNANDFMAVLRGQGIAVVVG